MTDKALSPATQADLTPSPWKIKEGRTTEISRRLLALQTNWNGRMESEPKKVLREMQRAVEVLSLKKISAPNIIISGKTQPLSVDPVLESFRHKIKTYGPEKMMQILRVSSDKIYRVAPEEEEKIAKAVEKNKNQHRNIRLVFHAGTAPRYWSQRWGTSPKKQPCIFKNSANWMISFGKGSWIDRALPPSFYLVDFLWTFKGLTFGQEENEIGGLKAKEPDIERCDLNVFSEPLLPIFQWSKKKERITNDGGWWYHRSNTKIGVAPDGQRVRSGRFDGYGFDLSAVHPVSSNDRLRVCLALEVRTVEVET